MESNTKSVKNTLGLLSLLNFLTYKYGPEKIDTVLFTDIICTFCSNANPKIRNESYKFFVLIAQWKMNSDSVKMIVKEKLKKAQKDTLYKMLRVIEEKDKFEKFSKNLGDGILEESDEDTWYDKDGTKMSRKEFFDRKNDTEKFKFGPKFLQQTVNNYR